MVVTATVQTEFRVARPATRGHLLILMVQVREQRHVRLLVLRRREREERAATFVACLGLLGLLLLSHKLESEQPVLFLIFFVRSQRPYFYL